MISYDHIWSTEPGAWSVEVRSTGRSETIANLSRFAAMKIAGFVYGPRSRPGAIRDSVCDNSAQRITVTFRTEWEIENSA